MAKKLCFKMLRLLVDSVRWVMLFIGACAIGGTYFGGDVHALFGACLFTFAVWLVEYWLKGEMRR